MSKKLKYLLTIMLLICSVILNANAQSTDKNSIVTGAEQVELYLPLLKGKKVGLLVNHTSTIGTTHLLDTLLAHNIEVVKIFAPEHGFRGQFANGETVADGKDLKTGLPIISLYGKNKKPETDQLADIDWIVYDIQDVGARFYTYISTMHYMMEACAENQVQMIILDRPNPNAHYIDGPVLESKHQSFVGIHPIPIVYALTAGELAGMIVGEKWINAVGDLDLKVITLKNWTHQTPYSLPISPSPNLPNDQSVLLYPSLCLFEGTKVSVGRGTNFPFQVIGLPKQSAKDAFSFTPVSKPGFSQYPKHENELCFGKDLRMVTVENEINLEYIIQMYNTSPQDFFNSFFTKLAGTQTLEQQIKEGLSVEKIKDSWQESLNSYKKKREKYLLYED